MIEEILRDVKLALGITGEFQDDTLKVYIKEVIEFLKDAGVKDQFITSGIAVRGVADLWNYGSNNGKLSEYFMQRAVQLSLKS